MCVRWRWCGARNVWAVVACRLKDAASRGGLAGLCALLLACSPAPAAGAHEWRAAWGAPYPLPHLEALAAGGSENLRLGLALERPFGVETLTFQRVSLALPLIGLDFHGGSLSAPAYREWHLGMGRWVPLGRQAEILLGARLFGLSAGGETHGLQGAATVIARVRPPRLGFLRVEGGVVDFAGGAGSAGGRGSRDSGESGGSGGAHHAPAAVGVCRVRLDVAGARVVIERLALPGETVETSLAASCDHWPLRFGCALRCAIGEASVGLALRRGALEVSLVQRWHPQLGWTPGVALGWRDAG